LKPAGTLGRWARDLKTEVRALYLAYRDPRTPLYARLFVALVVGYALSPIDLIPDPIPVLGHLDDLVLVPLGIALAVRMIPPEVLAECRERATRENEPSGRWAMPLVVAAWLGCAALGWWLVVRFL
jgi:uncharacterized membrane protein YkvA (DUF1232 family)